MVTVLGASSSSLLLLSSCTWILRRICGCCCCCCGGGGGGGGGAPFAFASSSASRDTTSFLNFASVGKAVATERMHDRACSKTFPVGPDECLCGHLHEL